MGEGGEVEDTPSLEEGEGGVRHGGRQRSTHLSPPSRKGRGCLLPLPIPRPLLLLLPTMVWLMPAPLLLRLPAPRATGYRASPPATPAAMHMLPILAMQPGNVLAQIHVLMPAASAASPCGRRGSAPPWNTNSSLPRSTAIGAGDAHRLSVLGQCRLGCGPAPFSSIIAPIAKPVQPHAARSADAARSSRSCRRSTSRDAGVALKPP